MSIKYLPMGFITTNFKKNRYYCTMGNVWSHRSPMWSPLGPSACGARRFSSAPAVTSAGTFSAPQPGSSQPKHVVITLSLPILWTVVPQTHLCLQSFALLSSSFQSFCHLCALLVLSDQLVLVEKTPRKWFLINVKNGTHASFESCQLGTFILKGKQTNQSVLQNLFFPQKAGDTLLQSSSLSLCLLLQGGEPLLQGHFFWAPFFHLDKTESGMTRQPESWSSFVPAVFLLQDSPAGLSAAASPPSASLHDSTCRNPPWPAPPGQRSEKATSHHRHRGKKCSLCKGITVYSLVRLSFLCNFWRSCLCVEEASGAQWSWSSFWISAE